MLKTYYMLTKPGIIMGNVITTAAGFALASRGLFDVWLFAITLLGLGLVIASAGVFNNYIDRAMDAKMLRTRDRALASGKITSPKALAFGTILGCLGVLVLAAYTNLLTVLMALTGFVVYLVLYAYWKYRSFYGTLIGSIAGAIPPVVGYCAVSHQLDMGALLLFMILVMWQMPHFFAIAIYRMEEYAAASIPVLPIQRGMMITKMYMVFYILAFMSTAMLLTVIGYTGNFYLGTAVLLSLAWLALGIKGFKWSSNDTKWARHMFVVSLVVIMGLCFSMAWDVVV
jgi:protoheme IX farnesyltransferase